MLFRATCVWYSQAINFASLSGRKRSPIVQYIVYKLRSTLTLVPDAKTAFEVFWHAQKALLGCLFFPETVTHPLFQPLVSLRLPTVFAFDLPFSLFLGIYYSTLIKLTRLLRECCV